MLLDELKKISKKLTSVNDLLEVGNMVRVGDGKIWQPSGAVFHTIIDEPQYQCGTAVFVNKGDATEEHSHPGVLQYIIQVKGKVAAFIDGTGCRTLDVGECCSLKPGLIHKFVALKDDSVQLWVCIPAELGYKK